MMKKMLISFVSFCIFQFAFSQDKPEGLFINSKVPDFIAKDQNGNDVVFKNLRKKGNVVVVFTRGSWCPYCNHYLKRLQDSLALIKAKHAEVIAITPETGEGINFAIVKSGATFPIIYDANMKIANSYHVAYKVDDRTLTRYKNSNPSIDLLKINNQVKDAYLPITAVYVVNTEGSVIYRYFDEDYKKRVPVKELLQALQ